MRYITLLYEIAILHKQVLENKEIKASSENTRSSDLQNRWNQYRIDHWETFENGNWKLCWLCSHGLEARSESRFRTWFGPFLIWSLRPCERKAKSVLFQTRFGSWSTLESSTSSTEYMNPDSCVLVLFGSKPCMGQSARTFLYYWWLSRRLQCIWTHVEMEPKCHGEANLNTSHYALHRQDCTFATTSRGELLL